MPDAIKVRYPCGDCGQEFDGAMLMGKQVTLYCPGCREKRERAFQLERLQTHAKALAYHRREWLTDPQRGIPRRYQDAVWDDFKFDRGGGGNRARVEQIRQYAVDFPLTDYPVGAPSLVIARDVNGVGKTLLACLILKDIIGRYEELGREICPFQFWTASDVKLRLKSADRFGSTETQEQVYQDFASMRLLVLDDVGKENLTGADASFSYDMYFTIINRRYNAGLPLVLTSNLNFEPWRAGEPSLVDLMGRASASRLVEMTGGKVYLIEGEDRR